MEIMFMAIGIMAFGIGMEFKFWWLIVIAGAAFSMAAFESIHYKETIMNSVKFMELYIKHIEKAQHEEIDHNKKMFDLIGDFMEANIKEGEITTSTLKDMIDMLEKISDHEQETNDTLLRYDNFIDKIEWLEKAYSTAKSPVEERFFVPFVDCTDNSTIHRSAVVKTLSDAWADHLGEAAMKLVSIMHKNGELEITYPEDVLERVYGVYHEDIDDFVDVLENIDFVDDVLVTDGSMRVMLKGEIKDEL